MKKQFTTFTELHEHIFSLEDNFFLTSLIKNHLMIEYLLIKCLELKKGKSINKSKLRHIDIINLAYVHEIINLKMKETLIEINKLRNKLAHELDFLPSVKEYSNLIEKIKEISHDMTDGITQTLEELENKNSLKDCEDWIYYEPFMQLGYDLHYIYQDLSGEIENFH